MYAPAPVMTEDAFLLLGGKMVYIKKIISNDAKKCFPVFNDIPDGIEMYIAFRPDGSPFAANDSREATMWNALDDGLAIMRLQ